MEQIWFNRGKISKEIDKFKTSAWQRFVYVWTDLIGQSNYIRCCLIFSDQGRMGKAGTLGKILVSQSKLSSILNQVVPLKHQNTNKIGRFKHWWARHPSYFSSSGLSLKFYYLNRKLSKTKTQTDCSRRTGRNGMLEFFPVNMH